MSPTLTQDGRFLRATTPLGKDVLVPVSLRGTEGVSRLFEFTVVFVSENANISAEALLGESVTIHIVDSNDKTRHINGIVSRFVQLGKGNYFTEYRAQIVPALWWLSLSSNCRTFENKTTIDILTTIFQEDDVREWKHALTSTMAKLPYVVQYRETNLAFVSRLLEAEGWYYRFDHADGKHTLVVTDAKGTTIPKLSLPKLRVEPDAIEGRAQADCVYSTEREFTQNAKSYKIGDHFSWRADRKSDTSSITQRPKGMRYDFVSAMGDDAHLPDARHLIEVEEARHDVVRGKSTAFAMQAGSACDIEGLGGGNELANVHLLEVTHHAEAGDVTASSKLHEQYENSFVAIPTSTRFRPPRVTPRPVMQGTQTACVVGVDTDGDIDVDKEGAILLEFPWDQGDGKDKQSKHRVHVASAWSGKNWGFIQTPRVGQEVLVEYIEGDLERPIVTGRVYNTKHPHPFKLPDDKTISGWRSQTLKGESDNHNEIHFDDKKGSEKLFVQAEKDMEVNIKHDRTTKIKNDDTRTLEEGNDTHTIKKGKQTITIKQDHALTVQDGNHTVQVDKGDMTVTVQTGDHTLKVDKGNMTVKVAKGNIKVSADAGSISIEAMQKIELKVGSNSITIDMSGVTIKGVNVKSEAQAQAEFKGAMTKVDGSGMCEVHGGGMASLKSDGMTMVKGSITMIN